MDYQKLLDKLTRDPMAAGLAGGLLSGMLGGALGSGKSSKLVKAGTLAAVGGLAYKAWQDYQRAQAGAAAQPALPAAAEGTAFLPAGDAAATAKLGLRVLQAMIAAAKADGRIDPAESQRIFERLGSTALDAEEKAFLLEEMGRPLNVDQVVANVSGPEMAAEIYTASRLVVDEASAAESAYLQLLAARLGLPEGMRTEIDRVVAAAR